MEKMTVRAKMKVQSIQKSGSEKYPNVNVQLGAVYSNDPESENRSFASATPSASISINIDAGRPAAQAFQLGQEFYVDFTPLEVLTRWYIGDQYPEVDSDIILEDREGNNQVEARFTKENPRYSVTFTHAGELLTKVFSGDTLVPMGWTHWRYKE
jgi:hypothetical protein